MLKSLLRILKQDKEKYVVPQSVQDTIPIRRIWPDGIFLCGNKYTKCWRFTDINYSIASKDDKTAMFLNYSELLNSLDTEATTKLTICNRKLNRADFEKTILLQKKGDGLDHYRDELNEMLMGYAAESNHIVQDRYITISVVRKSIEDARTYFARISADLTSKLGVLESRCTELDAAERLRIFHDFYRSGDEVHFNFDLKAAMHKGHNFKDYICPDTFEFEKDHFRMGEKFGRVIFLRDYASYIKDSLVTELCELGRNLFFSIDIVPVPTDEAVREVENKLLGVETNITNWQRRQNQNNNFSAVIPYDMEQQRKEAKEFLDDLVTRDQRMMFALMTMVHVADTLEQLDSDTDMLLSTARKHLCQFAALKWQQLDGLNTALPFGVRKIDALRTLSTESLAVFMPFCAQDISQADGICYGKNSVNKNMIIANRKNLLAGHSFILGTTGSGKSMTAKAEIINFRLKMGDDVVVVDPQNEYRNLVEALQGETISISATSKNHINAMTMGKDYGDGGDPIVTKSEFIMSLCEQLIGSHDMGAKEKSLIDRCTALTYKDYIASGFRGDPPTLNDFHARLLEQPEPEAGDIALAMELFTSGSLNTFAKQSNVNVDNPFICYDISELGKQLMPIGMLVVLDSIYNRVMQNREKGKTTWIIIDEIHQLFAHEYSANFLYMLWKQMRKFSGYCTGITQNVEDLLQSYTARTMLSNSEFIIMLNQAATDRIELARLLNISELQLSYITNAEAGSGLLRYGSSLVPFKNQYPHNSLYKLMSTKPNE